MKIMKIYTISYYTKDFRSKNIIEYFGSLKKAEKYLSNKGYTQTSERDFKNDINGMWELPATDFFEKSIAMLGYITTMDDFVK